MAKKIYAWRGDSKILMECAENACRYKGFKIKLKRSHSMTFTNRAYNGDIFIDERKFKIEITAGGGVVCMNIFMCIMFFMFGITLYFAWRAISKKPKIFINQIISQMTTRLMTYPNTALYEEGLQPEFQEYDRDISQSRPETYQTEAALFDDTLNVPSSSNQDIIPPVSTEPEAQIDTPQQEINIIHPVSEIVNCDICNGTGICTSCNGEGKIRVNEICSMCDGSGVCFCKE